MIDLPSGPKPDWELEEDSEDLKSIPESSALAYSLRQSRERWLTCVFPKFSGKPPRGSKGAVDNSPVPPPHTIQTRGKCDVQLGPHVFTQTTFFEVHYLSVPTAPRPPFVYQPSSSSYTGSYGTTPAPYTSSYTTTPAATPSTSSSSPAVQTSAPLLSSLSSATMITPALINQVNAAASSNPTLANLLQLAAAGKASSDQLKTLGVLIQSLAASPIAAAQYSQMSAATSSSTPPTSSLHSASPLPTKEFDLVIEFREAPFDRWIFPRGTTVCDRVVDKDVSDGTFDIVITSYISLGKENNAPSSTTAEPSKQHEPHCELVTMTLKKAPVAVWETLERWAGGQEKMNANRPELEKLKQKQSRVYIGYRLPEGPLLAQLQAAISPPYVLKPIKPASTSSSRPKRARQRKQSEGNTNAGVTKKKSVSDKAANNPVPSVATTPAPATSEDGAAPGSEAGPSSGPITPASTPALTPAPAPPPAPSTSASRPPLKKPRTSASGGNGAAMNKFKHSPYQIRCTTCHQTDVPLMLGGRFCRPCVEAGRATVDIPQPLNYVSRPTYTPTYIPPPSSISSNPYMALVTQPFARLSSSPAPIVQNAVNTTIVPTPTPSSSVPATSAPEPPAAETEEKSKS